MARQTPPHASAGSWPAEMFAVLCKSFKETYQVMLRAKYAGALVSECRTGGIATVPFGIELGKESLP
jgi:hypothetical protein